MSINGIIQQKSITVGMKPHRYILLLHQTVAGAPRPPHLFICLFRYHLAGSC